MSRELIVKKVKVKGKEFEYRYLHTKQAVVILPVLADDKIVFVEQNRIPIGESILELPAGGLEQGEDPLVAAGRELSEETGYQSNDITLLTSCYSSPGITDEILHFYIAKVSFQKEQELDDIEEIDVHICSLEEALNMIKKGKIKDAKTVLAILWYRGFLK